MLVYYLRTIQVVGTFLQGGRAVREILTAMFVKLQVRFINAYTVRPNLAKELMEYIMNSNKALYRVWGNPNMY